MSDVVMDQPLAEAFEQYRAAVVAMRDARAEIYRRESVAEQAQAAIAEANRAFEDAHKAWKRAERALRETLSAPSNGWPTEHESDCDINFGQHCSCPMGNL